jgi:hypothetical protein
MTGNREEAAVLMIFGGAIYLEALNVLKDL